MAPMPGYGNCSSAKTWTRALPQAAHDIAARIVPGFWNGICISNAQGCSCCSYCCSYCCARRPAKGHADFTDIKLMDRHAYPAALPQALINDGALRHGVTERRM